MRKLVPLLCVSLVVSLPLFAGCKDDPPPAPKAEPKKPTPVPSDLVFNEFINDDTKVKGVAGDGGVNMAGITGDGGGTGASAAPEAPAPEVPKLVDAGQDPKAARRYAFAVGKPETRIGTARMSVSVEAQGAPPQSQAQPALELTLKLSAKAVQKGSYPIELKLEKLGLAEGQGLGAQAAAELQKQLGPLAGLTAKMDVAPKGTVGELSFAGDAKMQQQGTAEVLDLLQQTAELLFVQFPEEPIGVGAKWDVSSTSAAQGTKVTTATHFQLKEWAGDAGVVTAEIVRSSPKSPIRDPRMPGATMEISGKGTYTFAVRLDKPATKVAGDSTMDAKIEAKTEKGVQVIHQIMKSKHTIETPGAK